MNPSNLTIRHLFFIFAIICASGSHSLAAETDWISPTAHAPGPLFNGFETNPTGAYAEGGLIAQDSRTGGQGRRGDEHRYYGFNLSTLPPSVNITGIAVKLRAKKDSKQDVQMVVMVSRDGLNTWNGTTLTTGDLEETLTDYELGGATELWGLGTTTSDDLKALNNFAIKIQNFSGNNAPKSWQLDWLQVKIFHGGAPDLTIAKSDTGDFTQGDTGTYTITVTNDGDGATTENIIVTDPLPLGLSYSSFTGTGWTETGIDPLTLTYTGTLAAGGSSTITLNVNVASDAPPTVTNTATVSGGGESNTANNTATDATTVVQLVPNLIVTKSVIDENGGNLVADDILLYTVVIQNPTGGNLIGATFTDDIPDNTTYVLNSVSAPAGATIDDSSSPLSITGITVPANSQDIITFRVQVNTGVSDVTISNTGTVTFNADGDPGTGTDGNEASQATDGDTATPGDQPTTIDVAAGPNFDQTTKSVALLTDADGDGFVTPGDTLRYTIVIRNTGDTLASGVTFTDDIPLNTTYVTDSVAATRGIPTDSIQIGWSDVNPLNPGDSVTITFDVEIDLGLLTGTIISNQGTVNYNSVDTFTDADLTAPGKQTTDITIGGTPYGLAIKNAQDENGGNLEPGDTILYTIVFQNQSGLSVEGIEFIDQIPNNTSYISGSASAPAGSTIVSTEPTLRVTGIDMPAYAEEIITFRVQVHDAASTPPLPDGVTQISNQGTIFYDSDGINGNDATQLTDGDTTQPGNQPTVLPLATTGPNFDQTSKSVAILTDTDPLGIVNTGDTLQYTIIISNTGDTQANGVTFTDPIPGGTSYSGGATASEPGIDDNSGNGPIDWSGNINSGASVTIEFSVTVTAASGIVSNQGTVTYNSIDTLTDGNLSEPGKQPTNVTIGGTPYGVAVKTAIDENGGTVEPGDIIRYEILFDNQSPADSDGMEFTDVIPNNTTYIDGSATATSGSLAPDPPVLPLLKFTGIDVAANSQETITFRVRVDNPLSPGITQISNQGTVFYDSDGVNGNDATQLTDGNPSQPGNQPTISTLAVGTISGTVFDDNGDGGGTAFNGSQDGDEPGFVGATVQLLDEFYALLYGTLTIVDGFYEFTGLPSGNYHVFLPNPPGYTGTTPDILPVTLDLSGGSQTADADFGIAEITGTGGDLSIVMQCSALYPGGYSDQLITTITVSNSGPDTVTGIVLTDDFSALIAAGLDNVAYSVNGGPTILLTDNAGDGDDDTLTLGLADISDGDSTVIRIYADVPINFNPVANTAAVSAANDISAGDNTTFCTNPINNNARRAIDFDTADNISTACCNAGCDTDLDLDALDNAYVTVSGTSDFDLPDTGTMEAWVYPTRFIPDAGIIVKGTTEICYGVGLGGGTVFSEGAADNICFVVYDSNNTPNDTSDDTKHVLAATKALTLNKWHHVACVWDSAGMKIYINGVEEAASSPTISGGIRTNTESLIIGMQPVDPETQFFGTLDEVRVWKTARSADVIRQGMCRKVYRQDDIAPDNWFNDLMGYWRFDEDSGPVCGDVSGRGNIGIITNAVRVCSSAPIGDVSIFDYDDEFDYWPFSEAGMQLPFPDGFQRSISTADFIFGYDALAQDEEMTVSADGGTWSTALKSGLHIYWVNPTSERQPGPMGTRLLSDRGFWGVFVTGGENPTYKIEYNYDSNDDGTPGIGDDNELQLFYRHSNCQQWRKLDADIDTDNNLFSKDGLSGTEFILATDLPPRNAIEFGGTDDYVRIPDDDVLDLTDKGTLEAWVYISAYQNYGGIVMKGSLSDFSDEQYTLQLGGPGYGSNSQALIGFRNSSGTDIYVTSNDSLDLNTWYHVAGVWDYDSSSSTGTMVIYVNGVENGSDTITSSPQTTDTSGSLNIGINPEAGTFPFNGIIDEVRVWNTARNQAAIRTTMCQKLAGDETGLVGYWRFDEETDSDVCPDETNNDNDGEMKNFGPVAVGLDPIREHRVCSSAPIGDDSAFDYFDLGAGVSAQLAHSDGDFMTASENSGTWNDDFSGLHVYRVDEAPVYQPDLWEDDYYDYQPQNGMVPPDDWSSIDYYRYWGVFVTDPVNDPSYDVVYDYTGNPMTPDDDSVLDLARRDEFCDPTWEDTDAALDTGNDTLSLTNETGTEYVLGGQDDPLAIALASFTAIPDDGCVAIAWETATEIDTAGFYLWRSHRRLGDYTRIEKFIASNANLDTRGAAYTYVDCDADLTNGNTWYYMLQEITTDGKSEDQMHGPIGPVSEILTAAQVAAKDADGNKSCFINVLQW